MKREIKGFICGFIVATIGLSTVFAASGIKSASFNTNKVIFNGNELNLSSNPMISVIKEGEFNASNYMPVRAVLEAMGYSVDWDGNKNAVVVNFADNTSESLSKHNTQIFTYVYDSNHHTIGIKNESAEYYAIRYASEMFVSSDLKPDTLQYAFDTKNERLYFFIISQDMFDKEGYRDFNKQYFDSNNNFVAGRIVFTIQTEQLFLYNSAYYVEKLYVESLVSQELKKY